MKTKTELFWYAFSIAFSGIPISMALNFAILPFFLDIIKENYFFGTIFLTLPYFIASVIRIFVFDYYYEKYNVHLDPAYYIKKMLKV